MMKHKRKIIATYDEGLNFLRLFIEKSDELHSRSYFAGGINILKTTIKPLENGKAEIDFSFPTDEQRDAILLLLRFFWQESDLTYYKQFIEIFNIMDFSTEWKDEIVFLFSNFEFRLNEVVVTGPIEYTNKDIFTICLYGDYSHFSKREQYKTITKDENHKQLIDSAFHQIVISFSSFIMSLANASRKELRIKGLISDSEYKVMEEKWCKSQVSK